jgi:hypothetical protein
METWQVIVGSLVSSGVFSGLVVYVLREWMSTRIQKSIEHEYETKRIKMKADLDGQLEGLKSGYKRVLDENQIRFSRLHAEQAGAVKEVYQLLVDMEFKMKAMVTLQFAPSDPEEFNAFFKKQQQDAAESYHACRDRYRRARILLPQGICLEIDKLLAIARRAFNDYNTSDTRTSHGGNSQDRAYEEMQGPFEEARKQLEDRFREILGLIPSETQDVL